MDSVINIEDRLKVIKAIFELSIDAKVFPDDIYIYTINQKWKATSNFRSESLSLSIDDPRHKKTIKIIYGLSTDILVLFDQLKQFIGEIKREYKYRIDCMPGGNSLVQLYLVKIKVPEITKELSDEEIMLLIKEDQFIDGGWFPYRGINNEDNSDSISTSPLFLMDFVFQIHQFLKERIILEDHADNLKPSSTDLKKVMSIPTKATPQEILDFWFKLTGNNEKGDPYWESEKEIEHFVYQNFDVFQGVDEIKVFNPNMNKSELNHVTWTFYRKYGTSKTKKQYEKLLMKNFTKFKNDSNVYSNIKDQLNNHLKNLFK